MSFGLLDPVIAKCRETFSDSVAWRVEVQAGDNAKPTIELIVVQRRLMGRSDGIKWKQAELASSSNAAVNEAIEALAKKMGARRFP